MEIPIWVITPKEKSAAKVSTPGSMGTPTMAIGWMVRSRATESGKIRTETVTSVNGKWIWRTATESTSGLMATATKVSGKTHCATVRALMFLRTETSTWANTSTALLRELASTGGLMVTRIAESLPTVRNKVKVSGRRRLITLMTPICTSASTKTTWRMVRVNLNGPLEAITKAITLKTLSRGTVRWPGEMDLLTKVIGMLVSRMVLVWWSSRMESWRQVFSKTTFSKIFCRNEKKLTNSGIQRMDRCPIRLENNSNNLLKNWILRRIRKTSS